ncbi:MAG: M20/M25/M40 family metallo-hydrolase [bacterium]|nr:M20/M25/M40 family metallo-hydrolase [bacterium]
MRRFLPAVLAAFVATPAAYTQGDPEVVARIIEEGTDNSQVWDTLEYLSYEIGTRLTGSTGLMRANAWTRDYFAKQGLKNAHLRKWGEVAVRFDRGPSSAMMVKPVEREMEFTARSWSAGTDGPLRGHVVREPKTLEDLEAVRDKLPGAWLLGKSARRSRRNRNRDNDDGNKDAETIKKAIEEAIEEAGIAGRIRGNRNDLTVTSSVRGWRELDFEELPTDVEITIRRSDYDAMNSRISDGEDVEVVVDLQHHFTEGPFPVFNTVAEIPGTEFPDEIVICSAHLDSWDGPGSMGTQDNGTGSSVMLEAARMLMAAGAQPRRTIRFVLWTGEEQGLLGSRAYAESLTEEERARISAVFVDDGGTNYQGGLVCVEDMLPMLEQATAAVNETFPDMKAEHVVRDQMPRGGGSDHASFNQIGIPGFFWLEKGSGGREEKSYRFIHHTQHDTPRYAVKEYLIQSATCQAVTAYNIAMADTMLPRYVKEDAVEASAPVEDPSFVATAAPISGRWKANYTGEDAWTDEAFHLTFEMAKDGRARGTLESSMSGGVKPLQGISFDEGKGALEFAYESSYGKLVYKATMKEGGFTGTVGLGDQFSQPFKAIKAEAKPEEKPKDADTKGAEPKKAGEDSGSSGS